MSDSVFVTTPLGQSAGMVEEKVAVPPGGVKFTDKKGIARRYGISPRKVDYLRAQSVLPSHIIPPRCIRFDIDECDAAMAKFRHPAKP